jgi:hypothetical protein
MTLLIKIILRLSRAWRFLKPTAVCVLILYLLFYFFDIQVSKINDNDFMFNFLGILLGFSITIFIFLVSVIDRIKENTITDRKIPEKLEEEIKDLYFEIKDDIIFNFLSMVIVASLYLIESTNIPFFINHHPNVLSKEIFLKSLRCSLFLLNIYAIYDLMSVTFKLSDTSGVFKKP